MLRDIELSQSEGRLFCWTCRQPGDACYCAKLKPFDAHIEFVILIHKIESRRRIATGRMSHLILEKSRLIEGDVFQDHPVVRKILMDPAVFPVVLYPGAQALDLSKVSREDLVKLVPADRRLVVFVIDGTWATARRTMRLSENLARLPRICFSPSKESQFRVRKQPAAYCLSTLEAIHHTIELLGASQGFRVQERAHDHLLEVFASMVDRQITFVP